MSGINKGWSLFCNSLTGILKMVDVTPQFMLFHLIIDVRDSCQWHEYCH